MADCTKTERRILDMWPKFEDGAYVMLGDEAVANSGENKGRTFIVRNIYFEEAHGKLRSSVAVGCYWNWNASDPYVKRSDSWEKLEEDAESIRRSIAHHLGDYSPSDFKQSGDSIQDGVLDLVRRAKALAEMGAAR